MALIPGAKDLESLQRRIKEQHIRILAEEAGGHVLANDLYLGLPNLAEFECQALSLHTTAFHSANSRQIDRYI